MNLSVDAASGQVPDYERDWRHPPHEIFQLQTFTKRNKNRSPSDDLKLPFVGLIFLGPHIFFGGKNPRSWQNLEEPNTNTRDFSFSDENRGLLDADFTLLRSSNSSGGRKNLFQKISWVLRYSVISWEFCWKTPTFFLTTTQVIYIYIYTQGLANSEPNSGWGYHWNRGAIDGTHSP